MIVLRELGFHVQPCHPVGLLLSYLQALEITVFDPLTAQRALNYMNDSLRSVVHVRFQPNAIACAAIALAARDASIELPADPAWFLVFDVCKEDYDSCRAAIKGLYEIRLDLDMPLVPAELAIFSETISQAKLCGKRRDRRAS